MTNRRVSDITHRVRGTYRKDRHGNHGKVDFASAYPSIPEHVTSYPGAADVWDEIRAVMEENGVYSLSDSNKLARYCILEAGFRDDPVKFSEMATRLTQLRMLENDLYLSPDSRAKMPEPPSNKPDPFAKFL